MQKDYDDLRATCQAFLAMAGVAGPLADQERERLRVKMAQLVDGSCASVAVTLS